MDKMRISNYLKKLTRCGKMLLSFCLNKPVYKEWHLKSMIIKPMIIAGKDCIKIGDRVCILNNARLEAVKSYAGNSYAPELIIHDGVTIQQNCHITCAQRVEIGENTAIVANVTITDIIHPYTTDDEHLINQPLIIKPVKIGKYCGIYNNVVVNAGVTIGNHVTIGANSVVNIDIPDYSVAAGTPVRIIKRYNPQSRKWEKTDKQGNFIA